jgi:DNA polymerase-3 subunit alpha
MNYKIACSLIDPKIKKMLYACHTYYSLLYGTMKVEDVVATAKQLAIPSLLLTDINNTSACFDFVEECLLNNIKPLCGVECRNENQYLYSLVAKNLEGFKEINEFISQHSLSQTVLPEVAPEFNNVFVIYATSNALRVSLRENEFIGVRPHEVNKVFLNHYSGMKKKLLAFAPVTYSSPSDFDFHSHLRAIDMNTLLSMLKPEQLARNNEYFIEPEFLKILYEDIPECIRNAEALIERCSFDFNFKSPKNKQVFCGNSYDDQLLLEKLAMEGFVYRYGKSNKHAEERLKKELQIINEMDFNAYFLVTWDIIRFSMSKDIYHVGRGSGGNSIVAYCLKITDIDPIELNLYFERFINPKRTSPPDFDIDYSWKDRDTIHEYIFNKHGREHTALLGAINTFQDSSVIRELGKVYGLPKNDIDKLVDTPEAPQLQNDITEKIFSIGKRMLDFPHHRSIHAGGVMVSEQSIYYYTALDLPPKGFPTTQWDMYVAEHIGFDKLDILSQRGLGHIKECTEIVSQNKGIQIDIHNVESFKKDSGLNQRLYEGEAIGCFYIESPAMRGLLKKLKCSNYLSLVAASSIIRPGVAQSGMMREYINRFHHPGNFKYLHPVFEEQLGETFGVMVYQEDVLKICHHFAGLTLSDADVLRRAMSGKYRSKNEFERIRNDFFLNCQQKKYNNGLAAEVWRQISSFAGYAFCKAHSASYAVESYQSLFLKTYYPNEFHVAVMNNFGGFYRTWVYVNEARRYGAKINLPDINKSIYLTTIYGDEIYLGWVLIKNLEEKLSHQIVKERKLNGEYKSLNDFVSRIGVGTEQLLVLIKIGAFRFTKKTKKQLMWDQVLEIKDAHFQKTRTIFNEPKKSFNLPELRNSILEDAYDEMNLLGFPLSLSRFDMLQTTYRGNSTAYKLGKALRKTVRMVGELVTIKYVYTKKREIMHFGCFLDIHGEFFDTVHFPDSLKKYPFTGYGVYLIEGKVVEEFGFASVEVSKLARLPYKPDPRAD